MGQTRCTFSADRWDKQKASELQKILGFEFTILWYVGWNATVSKEKSEISLLSMEQALRNLLFENSAGQPLKFLILCLIIFISWS